jgi:hypothetical protein
VSDLIETDVVEHISTVAFEPTVQRIARTPPTDVRTTFQSCLSAMIAGG